MTDTVYDDRDQGRFALDTPDGTAYAAYARDGQTLVFTHTFVPKPEQGHGVGKRLIAGALDLVRERGLTIIPQCPFVAAYVEEHPDARDLLAAR